jgi:hypothetical protein
MSTKSYSENELLTLWENEFNTRPAYFASGEGFCMCVGTHTVLVNTP